MKIKMDIKRKDSENTSSSDALTNEQEKELVIVSVSTKRIFSMRVTPGTTILELASELADQGYDVRDAEVTVIPYNEQTDLSNNRFNLQRGDSISFKTVRGKLKSQTDDISSQQDDAEEHFEDDEYYFDEDHEDCEDSTDLKPRHLSPEEAAPYDNVRLSLYSLLKGLGINQGEACMDIRNGKERFTFIPRK